MKTYEIVKYVAQANASIGVKAGMWAVVETTKSDFAFADTQSQALSIKIAAERSYEQSRREGRE